LRQKKRYLLLKDYPKELPENSKFLFQNSFGYVIKADLKGAELLRKGALRISGSIWKLKDHPKLLYPRKTKKKVG
jgi:hypothetical protein